MVKRLESLLDAGAAAVLATAVGFALSTVFPSLAWAGAAMAFFTGLKLLSTVARGELYFHLPPFAPASFPTAATPAINELLLTEMDRKDRTVLEPLVLDDVLAKIGPNSRVVRLFDPAAMPTPGQLKDRIDHHLHEEMSRTSPDASEELYAALNELRRSLR